MFWNLLQGNGTEIGVLIVLAGAVIEAMRRFFKAQKTANEHLKEDLMKVVNAGSERLGRVDERLGRVDERLGRVEERQREDSELLGRVDERLGRVEEQQKADAEQLKRVEEGQIRGEEQMKGIGGNMSALQEDIRAIWQMAFGSFLGKKPDQESRNRPNDSSHS